MVFYCCVLNDNDEDRFWGVKRESGFLFFLIRKYDREIIFVG